MRVALIGDNSIEFVKLIFSIWNDGDCVVLIDPQTPKRIAIEMMNDANVKKCYVEKKYFDITEYNISDSIQVISYDIKNEMPYLLLPEMCTDFKINYSKCEALVIYTSGTTGKSKGIILSHFAINTNADAIIAYMKPLHNDRMYILRSLTHSSTLTGELMVAIKAQIPLLIAPIRMPPRYVMNNIRKFGISIIGVNPSLLSMYAKECDNKVYDISSLRRIYVSGSVLTDDLYNRARRVFSKQELYNVYGLSEAAPRVAAQRVDCCKNNSVGKPILGVEVVIVDENGVIVRNGDRGIIHVSSPSLFDGYVCGDTKYKSLYRGWLNTGDIGHFDTNGELHIVSRVDDLIIIGAHKIYPADVEKNICEYLDVADCVVTQICHMEKAVLGCVYVSEKEIGSDVINKLVSVLMKYEIPRVFVRVDRIPRTSNGKIAMQNVKNVIINKIKEFNL